jgi:hypothetical protein
MGAGLDNMKSNNKFFSYDLDKILEDAPSDGGFMKRIVRRIEVSGLKEIYSKKYLLDSGLVTREEYKKIPASKNRTDELKRIKDWSVLNSQIVGAEYY